VRVVAGFFACVYGRLQVKQKSMCRILLLALIILTSAGCSSFHRDWRKAKQTPAIGIAGRWQGTWQSDSPKHHGRLRCLLTRIDEQKYEARFHAKYRNIFSFGYTALFTGRNENGVFVCAGEADLGKLAGGIYRYDAQISPTNFFSTYKSKYDNGIFQLQRPQ
jgi:hypothetical protein